MILVCPSCSGIDIEVLEEKFGKENIDTCCLGECGGIEGSVIGYLDGKFIEEDTEENFIKKIEENLEQ
ncbi:DUF1450 domain-containing protein [Caproiciproducens sp. MSJ-32]|uniref:DUF1450 domain-containing protein n=1 Tax=Caproiciproducens sp. MSJ-32 TaxID=2841527 RepID=UPI001C1086C6|nr:DUF1450 domain-containing protein [Caproiciproducens sp. MSJ-32]MBU5455327.1 DUF1450 domain-containing protein [Caproiciproducens sp. MSJ-32]